MKYLSLIFCFAIFSVQAAQDECFRDAKTHGNHRIPHSPSPECVEIIKNDPNSISLKSFDGKYHLYGQKFMLYVEAEGKRELLSGDQTELKEILKVHLNLAKRKVLVLQKNSISTFNLDFIGNVSPKSLIKSDKLSNATQVSLLNNEELIAVFYPEAVSLINADGESRHENEKLKPKLVLSLRGASSGLKKPTDLEFDRKNKKVYVLDSDRILVFSSANQKDPHPQRVISLKDIDSIHLKGELLYQVDKDGKESLVP